MAFLSLFSLGTAQAQINKSDNTNKVQDSQYQENLLVKGTVLDENNLALPGANVVLEGTTIGTSTDFGGHFTFPKKLKKGDVLVISYVGYDSKKVVIDNNKSASNIEMQIDMSMETILIGKVATKQVYKSKRK